MIHDWQGAMCRQSTATAKSLQSCPTLCDPIDGSPPGSPVPGILQARTLEWVAISFCNAWKWKVKVKSLSRVRPSATSWTAARQAPPSMGFSRQEYWSGVPLPSPGKVLNLDKFLSLALSLRSLWARASHFTCLALWTFCVCVWNWANFTYFVELWGLKEVLNIQHLPQCYMCRCSIYYTDERYIHLYTHYTAMVINKWVHSWENVKLRQGTSLLCSQFLPL